MLRLLHNSLLFDTIQMLNPVKSDPCPLTLLKNIYPPVFAPATSATRRFPEVGSISNCTHRVLRQELSSCSLRPLHSLYLIALTEYCDSTCVGLRYGQFISISNCTHRVLRHLTIPSFLIVDKLLYI